jgi:hypothetical protein
MKLERHSPRNCRSNRRGRQVKAAYVSSGLCTTPVTLLQTSHL